MSTTNLDMEGVPDVKWLEQLANFYFSGEEIPKGATGKLQRIGLASKLGLA